VQDDDFEFVELIVSRKSRWRRSRGHRRNRFGAVVVVGLCVLALGGIAAAVTGGAIAFNSCSLSALHPLALGENSVLFADDGSLLGVVPSTRNRQPLELDAIAPWLAKATVAIEDRRFWEHGALDYQAIARAFYDDLRAGRIVEGGSTITQELVRNLYIGNAQRTLSRKVKEACLAVKLADRWTKKQILAAYLNEVFYGEHAYGAQAAAQTFFSTDAHRLTLPQAALLAGLPQAPTVDDPFDHPDAALDRRNEVLRAMLVSGDISTAEEKRALAAPLGLRRSRLYGSIRHPNFFGWAEQQLVQDFGARRVEEGGLRVRTTLDPTLQNDARTALAGVLEHTTDPAGALVAIDPSTGAVKAMYAYLPSGEKLQFNLATQSGRTAGSAFKPFVLAAAINQGISLESAFSGPPMLTIPDPACSTNGVPWTVHNYADETAGYMNLLDATANSVNTIFAQLVTIVGPANVATTAHQMGITTPLQSVCSITLGTQPVNPLEMTDAYATLAARGIHHPPQAFDTVRGPDTNLIGTINPVGVQAIPQSTADQVTYALEGVVQHGTGTAASLGTRPAAGKTGTAENFIDAWFCGYVPQLAACVWIGYPKAETPLDNIEGIPAVFGGSLPAQTWNHFMVTATQTLPIQTFPTPQLTGRPVTPPPVYAPPPPPTATPQPPSALVQPPPQPQPDNGHHYGHGHGRGNNGNNGND
jgi:penicillin-binding protein 1A